MRECQHPIGRPRCTKGTDEWRLAAVLAFMHAIGQYFWLNPIGDGLWRSFSITDEERLRHVWTVGKTGAGKSTLIENLVAQDITAGRGFILLDPKGDLAEAVLRLIPPAQRRRVIYFSPADRDFPISFNPLQSVEPERREMVAATVLDTLYHLFRDSWGPQLEAILDNALQAILTVGGTLLGVKFLLTSPRYRARVTQQLDDPLLRDYWQTDFPRLLAARKDDPTLSTLNKIQKFISGPTLRHIVGQPQSAFDFRSVMDEGLIFVGDLSQGKLGQRRSALIGALLTSAIHSAALARERRDLFPVYLDEFHLFGSSSIAEMLSIIRGFGVSLTLANQFLAQLKDGEDSSLLDALIGNAGTVVSFQLGVGDAETLAPLFGENPRRLATIPPFYAHVRTPNETIRLAMLKHSGKTYPSAPTKILRNCRTQLATRRVVVEERIARFVSTNG